MKVTFLEVLLLAGFLKLSYFGYSQCEILNRVSPDGLMIYYMEPQVFYHTQSKNLKGCVYTDMENYFIALQPSPFPEKQIGKKIKEDLYLKLANNKEYRLNFYDTRYFNNDSIMEFLFLVDKRDLNDLLKFEATEVKMDMKGDEGVRSYVFKLHKSAIQEQLACFFKEKEAKKKKK